jgi:leucyl aminopeptidase
MGSAKTAFEWTTGDWAGLTADALVVLTCQSKKEGFKLSGPWTDLDKAMKGALATAIAEDKFEGKKDQVVVLRQAPGQSLKARRVVLVGLGPVDKLSPDKVEKAVNKGVSPLLKLEGLKTIVVCLPEEKGVDLESAVMSAVDGVYQATYVSAEASEPGPALPKVQFWLEGKPAAGLKEALKVGIILADARSFAKDLVNKPANLKTTDTMVDAAQAIGKLPNLTTTVVDDVQWIAKNMPSFYAVARGSLATDPPKFISVKYTPPGGKAKHKIALVGKTVIFDTGGYQVKPGDVMVTMKGDMTGGAMVLGTIRALAELAPKNVEVTVYLAATPNKIDSDAMLPDSIIDSTCGKKIEIRHTDAEGRLTLIDAVAKAAEGNGAKPAGKGKKEAKDPPEMILTIATLTGSAMRAVGTCIALMGNDTAWRNRVEAAARSLGEPIQPLDVVEDDYEDIKSKLDGAQLLNTSKNKNRGAQSAAAFVMCGAPEGIPMVHLDIAGADMTGDEKATGIGQKTLIRFILDLNQ